MNTVQQYTELNNILSNLQLVPALASDLLNLESHDTVYLVASLFLQPLSSVLLPSPPYIPSVPSHSGANSQPL